MSHVTVWRRLRQLAITLKKQVFYAERDELDRRFFQRALRDIIAQYLQVYFLDETDIDHRLHNPYARVPPGGRNGHTSVIPVSRGGRLVCPFIFEGHCGREVMETCSKELLLPSIKRWSVIVLDNASFLHAPTLSALAEVAGCVLTSIHPTSNPSSISGRRARGSYGVGSKERRPKSLSLARLAFLYTPECGSIKLNDCTTQEP